MAATKPKRKTKTKNIQTPGRGLASLLAKVEAMTLRKDLPDFKPGDTVRVHTRIKEGEKERIQIYEGVVIARSNTGANRSFNVRKISHGVGVERIFQEASPKVATVEVVQPGKVRRAKLYYLRELEGRAAKIERDVQTQVQTQAKAESAAKNQK